MLSFKEQHYFLSYDILKLHIFFTTFNTAVFFFERYQFFQPQELILNFKY